MLLFNYMDVRNPRAGGADRNSYEFARRLVASGRPVVWVTSRFVGAKPSEVIDGVRVERVGGIYTVYVFAFLRAIEFSDPVCVFESINSIPFFTPLFSRAPRAAFIHHIVPFDTIRRKVGIAAPLVYFVQNVLTPFLYRNTPILTNSESTRGELLSLGYRDVTVTTQGVSTHPTGALPQKERLVVAAGPVKPWKRIDHLIRAFKALDGEWRMSVFGYFEDPGYERYIRDLVLNLGLESRVTFHGLVEEDRKADLYARARIAMVGSEKEGWGLAGAEPQVYGCPVIGYDVPGVRDCVVNGVTGILVPSGDIDALGAALLRLAEDDGLWNRLSAAAMERGRGFTWDATYEDILRVLALHVPEFRNPTPAAKGE